jgi:hypothetical protein
MDDITKLLLDEVKEMREDVATIKTDVATIKVEYKLKFGMIAFVFGILGGIIKPIIFSILGGKH